ncbi:unnamed protein product [Paramecium pentaurelia]|uniref:Anoctamin transmembrane domain-containing protein n=1 Tax=Paramecium pentaurelia TaxID=43138 RepID=A0A8S1SJ60_9CILI|nr:unnamed protein product [Paramecium pentaurelia]
MSYFSLSPSSEILSHQSKVQSINNFENFVRSKRERDKTIDNKQVKEFRVIAKFLQKYEIYVQMLLGRQLTHKDEIKLSQKWSDNVDSFNDQMLPDAILRFPNPDFKHCESYDTMTALESMLYIERILKLDRNNIENKIFFKAVEGVLTNLEPNKITKVRFAFTQNSQLKATHQDLYLLDNIHQQISENNEPIYEATQKKQQETQNHQPQKMDKLNKLIQNFKELLNNKTDQMNNIRQKLNEILDIDYNILKRITPRKMKNGGFLTFANGKWSRNQQDTSDFLTLMRNIIIVQLLLTGYNVYNSISEDGKYIFCKLYATEDNLKTMAEKQKMKKKLNFCFSDLFSLEPVDTSFRPLRLNNRLWKPDDYDDLTDMFLYLRPKIINLIEDINFKRVAREVNQSRISNQLFQYGKLDIQDDDEQPTDLQWFAYYQYLVHLEKELRSIRVKNVINSDIAALINKQLTPYELYIIRNNKNDQVKKLTKQNIKDKQNWLHQQEVKKIQEKVFEVIQEYSRFFVNSDKLTTKLLKLFKQERLAQKYFRIFEEALKVANTEGKVLFNFWDMIHFERLDSYVIFTKPTKTCSTTMKYQHKMCWCKYQINEEKKISLFSSSERLKLVEQSINSLFQMNDLISKKVVISLFCVNDHYELFGHQTISQQENVEEDFYRKKMYHLEYEWAFNITKPWSTPINQICEYYGEKIGLYFYYTTYYTQMLLKIAFIALACNLIQWVIQDSESDLYYLLRIIFAFLQIQWTNLFVVLWQKKQLIFNIQFGQTAKEEISKQRSNFIGNYKRSVENDYMNSIGINSFELFTRMLFATSTLLFIIGLYAAIMIALYILTTTLKTQFQNIQTLQSGFFEILVTASINIVIIQFLDKVYDIISIHLTDFENQKSVKDYEESFIVKKYVLYFVSYVGPLIVIAFLNGPFDLYCKETNCSDHVQYHFATMIIWIFVFKTFKIMKLLYYVKKIPIFKYTFDEIEINKYIEEQSNRQNYAKSQERYGTLEDYMEIFLQNTLLSIFGYTFPFSFFLLWVQNIAQMQADKAKFIYYLQRPWPQNNSSLGVWNSILELINYVCILTNTGQMIIDYSFKYGDELILIYLTFLISNFMMNFIINGILGQIPFELGLFLQRQKYLIKSTIEQFKKTQAKALMKSSENLKKFPLFKVFGSTNIEIKGEFQTISSEDELFDHYDLSYMEKFCEVQKKDKLKSNKVIENNQYKTTKTIDNCQLRSTKNIENNQRRTFIGSYQKLPIESNQKLPIGSFQKIQESKQVLSIPFEEKFGKQKFQFKEEKENKKEQKQVVNRQISALFDQVMSQQTIQKYFQRRKNNYIFEIKKWKRSDKKKLQSAQEFLYQKVLLNSHKLIWSDLKIACRFVFMRRKTLYFRNLDYRKLTVFKKNQQTIQELYKEKAKNKFRKEFKLLQNSKRHTSHINIKEDIEELSILKDKQKNYINKHTWLYSRKVLLLKIKGVWFSQYRRQCQREPSFKIALDFLSKAKLIEKIKGETDLKEKLAKSLGDPAKIQYIGLDTLIRGYLSLQYNAKERFEIPLSTRQFNIIDYYINKKKSDIFTFIVDSFRDTYIFDHQYQKLQQFSMQYFEEELFPIENFKLKRQLNNTTWISEDQQGKKSLIQFLQIRHEQQFKYQKPNQESYGVCYLEGELKIRLSNLVDQVDDFYIKGYCIIKYHVYSQITLKQVIKYRLVHGIQYKLEELYEFLHACLQIIKQQKCGDLNLSSFVFHQRTYILFRSNHNDDDDLINLAQVIIEMILLKPVPDAISGFVKINTSHPLKGILQQMIYEDVQIDDLLYRIPITSSFVEINVEDEIKIKDRKKDEDFIDFLTLSIHQINLNFRMKQFKEALKEIQLAEDQLSNNKFTSATSIEQGFYRYFVTNQYKILTSHSDISFTFNVLLIIYIKFGTLLQMKFNFIKELEMLYYALMRSVESLDDLIKQLSLNVKLEQLTNTEQKIMLRRKLTRSNSQIDLQSKDRLQLIKDIRKNPSHIKIITKVKKELQRYCLQFQALHSLYLYFNQDFVYSAQILEDIQTTQTMIIQNQTKIIQVVEEPDDLTPNQFNFNQQSPTLDAALKIAQEENFELQKEFDDSPNYCLQLLYYKYLQLIVWFDGGKETFQNNYIDFLQDKVNSPVYEYFSSQLKIIQRYEIPKEYIEFNKECEIGKYIVISMNKWIEQSFFIPSKLEYSNDHQLMWKQLISYSVLEQSLENRQILIRLLNQKELTLPFVLLELRAIHQLLHLDNYVPLHKSLNQKQINKENLNSNFINNSLIKRLQKLHNEVSIDSDSWFHSKGLLQFRLYYILSLFFSFSKKHFENMLTEDSNLLFLGEMAMKQASCQSEADAKRVQASQIRMIPFDIKELKSDPKPNQVNKILSSYLSIRDLIESEEEDDLKCLIDKYNDQLKPSLIVLAIIQYYIAIDRKDLADIIILQTFKLIEYNVSLFDYAHPSFKEDLLLFQIKVNEEKWIHLEPFDRLFKRKNDFRSLTSDVLLNLQYVIYNQFFYLDIQFNIDMLEDQFKNFNLLPPQYNKLKSIYQLYLLYLQTTQGNINLEEIEKFIKIEFKQNTAYSAIIKNILVRYYINMQDYELALPLVQNILDYLYSLKILSNFVLKQINETSYVIENNVNFISSIVDVKLIEIQPEETDDQYFHIIDTQFIQENLIHYIDIITNLQDENQNFPKIQEIFKLLFDITEPTTQNNLFKVLSQLFLSYSKPEYLPSIFNQVYKNQDRQLHAYLNQRNSLKEKMSQLIIINELSEEDNVKMTAQINVLNYLITIYESVSKGITQTTILSWSIQAAEKAMIGYKIQGKNFQSSCHYVYPQLYLQLSDCFVRLGQISTALIHIDQAEEDLLEWFRQNKHPLKGFFFMKQALLRPLLTELFTKYTALLMDLDQINRLQIYDIIRALFQFNKKILQLFENSQDLQSLELGLLIYAKTLDSTEKITVDIFEMYQGNEPISLMKQVMKISPYDMTGINILIDAQSIFQLFNQNNQFTKIVCKKIEEYI